MLTKLLDPVSDKKGITLEIAHDEETHMIIVKVYHRSAIVGAPIKLKTSKFHANRWGIQMHDQVKAMEKANQLARELELEHDL